MSDTTPRLALNAMILSFDTFYLIRDIDVAESSDLEEFVKSGYWTHDVARGGWKCPRTALFTSAAVGAQGSMS